MKYIQTVNYKAWSADSGFSDAETIVNEEIELENPEYAKPEYWWRDYCNGNKNDCCENALITVTLRDAIEPDEDPVHVFEAWESDLF